MIRRSVSYFTILVTFLFAPIPYGHLLWNLSDGELKGEGLQYLLLGIYIGTESRQFAKSFGSNFSCTYPLE